MPTRYLFDNNGKPIKFRYSNGNELYADEDVRDNLSLLCLLGWLKYKGLNANPHIDSINELSKFYWSFGYKTGNNSAQRYMLEAEFFSEPLGRRQQYTHRGTHSTGFQLTELGLNLGRKIASDILADRFDFIIKPGGKVTGLHDRKNWKALERALLKPNSENVEKLSVAIAWTYSQATKK